MACPAGTHFLPVSPTLDDVRCHRPAIYLHDFDRFRRWFLKWILGNLPEFLSDTYSWTPFGIHWMYTCTVGQMFFLLIIQGWLAAPLILTCLFGFSCARVTPILAGGIGVARFVAGAFLVLFCVVWAS